MVDKIKDADGSDAGALSADWKARKTGSGDAEAGDFIETADEDGSPTTWENEFIEFFVEVTRLLAIPKSVGEVYGLLFCSPEPLTAADITEKLDVCKATVSYAMRFLTNIDAVTVTRRMGHRSDLFTASTSLRRIVSGFLGERVEPFLDERERDIDGMSEMFEASEAAGGEHGVFIRKRIKTLRNWNRSGRRFAPLLRKLVRGAD